MYYPNTNTIRFAVSNELEKTLDENYVYRGAALYGSNLLMFLASLRQLYAKKAKIKLVPGLPKWLFNDAEGQAACLQDEDELLLYYDESGSLRFSIKHLEHMPDANSGFWRVYGDFSEQWCRLIYRATLKESFPYVRRFVDLEEN